MTISPLAPASFPALPAIAGLRLATAASGMKYTGRDDLLLMQIDSIQSGQPSVAGVFTKSDTASAPVQWCQQILDKTKLETTGQSVPSAILVNAGNANAFTGRDGMAAVHTCCAAMAKRLGIPAADILMASTGVIGEPLDPDILEAQYDTLVEGLGNHASAWNAAAAAIMTTDTFAKGASATASIDGVTVQIAGIAKGSGMIAPDMATMLGFLATDAALPPDLLGDILAAATQRSFNAITVDSDTSTNDSVYLIATGAAGHDAITNAEDPRLTGFLTALDTVMQDLAKQIVRDGEGASKFITIDISGAVDDAAAHHIGMTIANSPLVKTAIAGEDANWGRLIMAIGKAGLGIDQTEIGLSMGGILVAEAGARVPDFDEAPVAAHMKTQDIEIDVSVGSGTGQARVWTCDLTHGYISINADYRS